MLIRNIDPSDLHCIAKVHNLSSKFWKCFRFIAFLRILYDIDSGIADDSINQVEGDRLCRLHRILKLSIILKSIFRTCLVWMLNTKHPSGKKTFSGTMFNHSDIHSGHIRSSLVNLINFSQLQ